jgi:hypothetical protein
MSSEHASHSGDRPTRRSDVEWVSLDGEAVLYDPDAQMLHRLNPEAAAVWAACDGISSQDEIISAIDAAYAGSPRTIAHDVPAAINRFRRLGLLRQAPGVDDADR